VPRSYRDENGPFRVTSKKPVYPSGTRRQGDVYRLDNKWRSSMLPVFSTRAAVERRRPRAGRRARPPPLVRCGRTRGPAHAAGGCRACAPRQSASGCDCLCGSHRCAAGRARGEARRGVRSVGRGNNGNAHGSLGIGRVRPHPRESLQTGGFSERAPTGANVRALIAPRRSPVRVRLAPSAERSAALRARHSDGSSGLGLCLWRAQAEPATPAYRSVEPSAGSIDGGETPLTPPVVRCQGVTHCIAARLVARCLHVPVGLGRAGAQIDTLALRIRRTSDLTRCGRVVAVSDTRSCA
jgi:hypothetical protein